MYEDIRQEGEIEDHGADAGQRGVWGKAVHFVRHFWRFFFQYSIPMVVKDAWKPEEILVSLVFSPAVLFLAYGGTHTDS